MSVVDALNRTICRLRLTPDIDVDRLCYELNESEWQEFLKYLQGFACYKKRDASYIDHCLYMGVTVRKRTASDRTAAHER